jgi:ABC-type glycerol-3-phosphate transport system substrate-binding protein
MPIYSIHYEEVEKMKYHARLFAILALLIVALAVAACAGSSEPEVQEEAAVEEEAAAEEAAVEEPAGEEMADEAMAGFAGLDQDLSGVTIRMANIGGQPYEAMYDSIKMFEEETGAKLTAT